MGKRTWSVALSLALVAGMTSALPARAQEAPVVRELPAAPNITDPQGDGNALSPEGGPSGGVVHTRADIWAAWFTTDAEFIYAHIQTEVGGRGNNPYFYRVRVDPGDGTTCLWITASMPSAADPSSPTAGLRDTCGGADERTPGELLLDAGPDETGVYTIKIPRSAHPVFADGGVLKQPMAETTVFAGTNTELPATPATNAGPAGGATIPTIDVTDNGTDFVVGSSGQVTKPKPPAEEPPGKSDPPGKGKKKGCGKGKGKGKQKGACPAPTPPPVAGCAPYVAGEEGAEAGETIKVTDAATAEAPLEVTVDAPAGEGNDLGAGVYDGTQSVFRNLQIDSSAAEAGLYVTYEFPVGEDHDIYLNYASGTEAAHSGGFNPAPVPVALGCCDGTGAGGHATQTSENLEGIRSKDCQGYTLKLSSFVSPGGEMTLKLWLGEPTYDPPADEPPATESAMEMFYRTLGL